MATVKQGLSTLLYLTAEARLAIKVFIIAICIGIFYGIYKIKDFDQLMQLIHPVYEEILQKTLDGNFFSYFFAILERNLTVALISIAAGLIYRYLPLAIVFLNGHLLGIFIYGVLFLSNNQSGILLLLPHGVFEIPAFIIAASLGISLSRLGKGRGFFGRFKAIFENFPTTYIIILLLIIAAIIESEMIILSSR
jgi:stage II sporulation protein M